MLEATRCKTFDAKMLKQKIYRGCCNRLLVVCLIASLVYVGSSAASFAKLFDSVFASVFDNVLAQASAQQKKTAQEPLQMRDLRIGRKDGREKPIARVVLELNHAAPFRIFTLQNPERLIVDLPVADTRQLLPPAVYKQEQGSPISTYRYGLFRPEILRFVFEFSQPISLLAHGTLKANKQRGFRLFIDTTNARDERLPPPTVNFASKGWSKYARALPPLWQKAAGDSAAVAAKVAKVAKTPRETTRETTKEKTSQKAKAKSQVSSKVSNPRAKIRRVMLDPGHGGIDSGARANGLREKTVVLTYARAIAKILTASGRYKVLLTRNGDFFVPLRQRYEIAQRLKADLLISVHADYLKNKNVRGATVYTLSEVASDRESAELASRENNADVLVGQNLAEFTPDVSTILIDLARKSTNRKSWLAAEKFVTHMKKDIPTLRQAHRYAGFVVLKSPNIPSLLLELGYMSNAKDARNLKQLEFREKVAKLVLRALDDYFKES